MGLGGMVVPGTLRDSPFILDAIHTRDGGPKPETAITDTVSHSDIVHGLFAICGHQFMPRIADIRRVEEARTESTDGEDGQYRAWAGSSHARLPRDSPPCDAPHLGAPPAEPGEPRGPPFGRPPLM
ncbi:Tn3 family transposase [Streptomyces sp. ME03-5709C]|nr:Tn3 family transposase [Streptomyces sp. ME03-5709C]